MIFADNDICAKMTNERRTQKRKRTRKLKPKKGGRKAKEV